MVVAAAVCFGAGDEDHGRLGTVVTDGPAPDARASVQAIPAGLREAVGQVLPSSFGGLGGSACVIDTTAVLGWWAGQGGVSAVLGASLSGSVGFGVGQVGSAFTFDGGQSVSLNGFAAVSSAVSVESWVKPIQTGGPKVLVSRWDFPSTDDGARAFELSSTSSGSLVWSTDETSTRRPEVFVVPVPTIFNGGWHHVAATWGAGQMRVFFDGVLLDTRASQPGVLHAASSTPLRLGAKSGIGDPLFFRGAMDEPTVWGRALSVSEVAAIHAAGSAGKCAPQSTVLQQAKLTAADGGPGDIFGLSVSISGNTANVGAPNTDGAGQNSGSTYVFVRTGTTWMQQTELVAADAADGDNFGGSVSLDGDTAIVGALRDDDAGSESGSAYVFVRSGSTWSQQVKLTASDAAAGERFGVSVDVQGDTAIIGADLDTGAVAASGSAYVFTRTGSVWSQQAKVGASDAASADYFGVSVAIHGTTAVVGAWLDDDAGSASGSAYVFIQNGTVWSQQAKLTASDAASLDIFGYSGSVEGGTAIVGASWTDSAGTNSGSAYVFSGNGTVWSQQAKLTASDAASGDSFGYSVSMDNGTAIVGSYGDGDNGTESGSAYIFTGL